MTRTEFSDEILMRFADGELDPDTSAEIERAMETDDGLVSRVALFMETRRAAQTAMKPLLDEPVPADLTRAVERMVAEKKSRQNVSAGEVLPFPRRAANGRGTRRWLLPIAASLAAVLGGLGGYWLASNGTPVLESRLSVAGIESPALTEALATAPSGEERQLAGSDQRFRAIATFRDSTQALCREFEVDSPDRSTVVSVACRSGAEWRVTFAVVAPGDSSGYAPASSTEALEAYLLAIDASPPMETAEEAEALSEFRGATQ
jgi:anti-sigma factor RsiW